MASLHAGAKTRLASICRSWAVSLGSGSASEISPECPIVWPVKRKSNSKRQHFLLQVHMWYLQKQPGFKEKFQPDKEEEPSEYVTVRFRGR